MKEHPVLQQLDSIPLDEDRGPAEFSLVDRKTESATLSEVSLAASLLTCDKLTVF